MSACTGEAKFDIIAIKYHTFFVAPAAVNVEHGDTHMITHFRSRSWHVVLTLAVTGCTDALSPGGRSPEHVQVTIGQPSSTGCTVSLVQPNNFIVEFPVNMPYRGSACGVNYTISVPPSRRCRSHGHNWCFAHPFPLQPAQ